jgi:hypothetical protein
MQNTTACRGSSARVGDEAADTDRKRTIEGDLKKGEAEA